MKVLVIRFSSIGDIVLTTPVVRCLKLQSNAEVHFLTKTPFKTVISNNPYLSKIWTLEDSMNPLIQKLKAESFDFIIDLHKNIRSLKIRSLLGVKSYSFNKLNVEKWLLVNLKWNILPDTHIVHRYMESVKPLGISYDGRGLDFFIHKKTTEKIKQGFPFLFEKKFITLVIGAAHETKSIHEELIIDFCNNEPRQIIFIGGAKEQDKGNRIQQNSKNPNILNLAGKLGINESAYVMELSDLVISPDTGMMHIAAALGKKIVSIWGNTVPEFGMYPFYPEERKDRHQILENKDLSCRPCSKIGFNKCPKEHFNCMKNHESKQLSDIVTRLIDI